MAKNMLKTEEIPDDAMLYYRIHASFYRNGRLVPGVFREIGDGMSTDWNKYSTPTDAVCRAKTPRDNGPLGPWGRAMTTYCY